MGVAPLYNNDMEIKTNLSKQEKKKKNLSPNFTSSWNLFTKNMIIVILEFHYPATGMRLIQLLFF